MSWKKEQLEKWMCLFAEDSPFTYTYIWENCSSWTTFLPSAILFFNFDLCCASHRLSLDIILWSPAQGLCVRVCVCMCACVCLCVWCVCCLWYLDTASQNGSQVFGVASLSLQGDQQIKVCSVRWLQAGGEDGESTPLGRKQWGDEAERKLRILTYVLLVSVAGGLCVQNHCLDRTACYCGAIEMLSSNELIISELWLSGALLHVDLYEDPDINQFNLLVNECEDTNGCRPTGKSSKTYFP